jgi:hypothetical protein
MAITERYVTTTGAGANDGTDEANAYTFAQMLTAIGAGSAAGFRYSNGALITTNMPEITYTTGRWNGAGADFWIYESLNFTAAAANNAVTLGSSGVMFNCNVVNNNTNASTGGILTSTANNIIANCDVALTAGSGGDSAIFASGNPRIIGCRIDGGPTDGIETGSSLIAVGNVIYSSGGHGIEVTATGSIITLISNTIVSCTGNGVEIPSGSTVLGCYVNNMVTDNGGFGFDFNATTVASFLAYNRTRDNSGGAIGSAGDWATATTYNHVTTDTGGGETDYTDAGSNDYTLISASPAKGVGHFAFLDIGALQRQETGGGGGSTRVIGG